MTIATAPTSNGRRVEILDRMEAEAVYQIVVETCGANPSEDQRNTFVNYVTSHPNKTEYRFGGDLGFGGKIRHQYGRVFVDLYTEDTNPKRAAAALLCNRRISQLLGSIL